MKTFKVQVCQKMVRYGFMLIDAESNDHAVEAASDALEYDLDKINIQWEDPRAIGWPVLDGNGHVTENKVEENCQKI